MAGRGRNGSRLASSTGGGEGMSDYEKLEWIHHAIQDALNGSTRRNGNLAGLHKALELIEELREPYLQEKEAKA